MSFGECFERAAGRDVTVEAIRAAVEDRRTGETERSDGTDTDVDTTSIDPEPSPARVVADADVLAADLLVGGDARESLDRLRSHSWTTLVASDPLLDDAAAVIGDLVDADLASDWRGAVESWREPVAHPAGDHPALASAYRGGAMQVVSLDTSLTGPRAAASLRDRMPVSVREPSAFAAVFSPERLYPEVVGGEYPGPDRDPRSLEPVG
ncbi:PIN domain-containing protein [Halorubrum pallidum]